MTKIRLFDGKKNLYISQTLYRYRLASLSSSQHNVKNFRWTRIFLHEPISLTLDNSLFSSFFFSTCWSKGICRKSSSQQMKLTVHPIQTGSGERPYDPFNASVLVTIPPEGQYCRYEPSRAFQAKRSKIYSFSVGVSAHGVPFARKTPIQNDAVRGNKVWKLGCVTPRRAHTPPELQETQMTFNVNTGLLL